MRTFLRLLVLAALTSAAATPAFAWPYLDVLSTETLSVEPPRYRTTFALWFEGYDKPGVSAQAFAIEPQDPQTLHLFDPIGPPGWAYGPCEAPSNCVFYSSLWGSGAPVPEVIVASFVSDAPVPCVRIWLTNPILLQKGAPTASTHTDLIDACLVVDAPVPACATSWGAIKSQYR